MRKILIFIILQSMFIQISSICISKIISISTTTNIDTVLILTMQNISTVNKITNKSESVMASSTMPHSNLENTTHEFFPSPSRASEDLSSSCNGSKLYKNSCSLDCTCNQMLGLICMDGICK